MKFSELITKLHSASQPHMLMYIDIRSDCELVDVNILPPVRAMCRPERSILPTRGS